GRDRCSTACRTASATRCAGRARRERQRAGFMGKRIVIVGAGPGGLAAAMILSAAGADVTVLERHGRVGGRSATIAAEGFRFDLGPTFFLYPRVLEEIFATCGEDLHRQVDLIRLDPQYRLVFEGGQAI